MRTRVLLSLALLLAHGVAIAVDEPAKPITPPAAKPAAKKPAEVYLDAATAGEDYAIQGEYAPASDGRGKMAAQVVAVGGGAFDVYFLSGGLPGAGYDKQTRQKVPAKTVDGKTTFDASGYRGEIAKGTLTGTTSDGGELKLARLDRQSPTLGAAPPQGATVLFDGSNVDAWNKGQLSEDKLLAVGTNSKESFTNFRLHIEFRTPFQPRAKGQGRGNSGVYVGGEEVQVLDSFGLVGEKNECGALYSKKTPDVNMCLPPLVWQTYDIDYATAPDGKSVHMTVLHNGVKIHDAVPVNRKPQAGINLQNHGNPVAFRNIWVAPLEVK